jgi:predicted glycosyltransferase
MPEIEAGRAKVVSASGRYGRVVARSDKTRQPVRTVLLYSHDTYGLGHLRRNTAIAHALLARDPSLNIVLLSGSSVADQFPTPPQVSVVRLPSVIKTGSERYRPVDRSRSMRSLRAERAAIISSTLLRLRPEVFLVDHAPLGMKGELSRALRVARERLPGMRVALGLRDILDDPAVVRRTWREQGIYEVLESSYDRVFVYGSQALFDVTAEYGFPARVGGRTRFTGYIAKDHEPELPLESARAWPSVASGTRRVLVMGGGGGDAEPLFKLFLRAWPAVQRDFAAHALLVTGPFMDARVRSALVDDAGELDGITTVGFSSCMLSLVSTAELVVSMGGYNSLTEVVAAGKPLICCPRETPRTEQLMRAEILERLGLARVVRLDSEPAELARAIHQSLQSAEHELSLAGAIDLGGGRRVADELLGAAVGRATGSPRRVSA